MHQHLFDIQHQVAAVGAVQCTGPDQREVSAQGAQVGDVLDPSEQVLVGRVVLIDHRDGTSGTVVDQQVHAVADESWIIRGRPVAAVVGQEQRAMFHHVGAHCLEVRQHLGQVLVAIFEFDGELADGQARDIGIEHTETLAQLTPDQRDSPQHGAQLFLDLPHRLLQACLLAVAQGIELLRAEHLVVMHWGQAVAGRGR